MSPSIWTRCAGRSELRPLRGRFCRVVEAQFRNSTRKLVDSDTEQAILEELLDAHAKPPVPPEFAGLHYLLSTPFRHPPLRNGSRFGTRRERGILYGARELPTAFAEVAYYRLVFLEGSAADVCVEAFVAEEDAPPFGDYEARISSPSQYGASQRLGAEMRGDGVQAALYVSARATGRALNLAVFDNAFQPRRPLREQMWSCTANRRGVEFRSRGLLGAAQHHAFARGQFEVAGKLPAPALD